MSNFTETELDSIWKKGRIVDNYDKAKYRLDAVGAMMIRDQYGSEGMYGWEVDHIFPRSKMEELGVKEDLWDSFENLRPMNAKNNVSKGDDYPDYKVCYEYNLKTKSNEDVEKEMTINDTTQKRLIELYGLNK